MADARAGCEGRDCLGRSDDATGQLMSGEESGLAYFGVWQPGTGTQWSRSGMAVDEFAAQDRIYYDQGLRITSLAGRDG